MTYRYSLGNSVEWRQRMDSLRSGNCSSRRGASGIRLSSRGKLSYYKRWSDFAKCEGRSQGVGRKQTVNHGQRVPARHYCRSVEYYRVEQALLDLLSREGSGRSWKPIQKNHSTQMQLLIRFRTRYGPRACSWRLLQFWWCVKRVMSWKIRYSILHYCQRKESIL